MDLNSKLFTFIKPYISFIDENKIFRLPFRWLYIFFAVVNVVFPFYLLYLAIKWDVFSAPAKLVVAFIILWLVVVFVSWVSAQLWWDRQAKVLAFTEKSNDFPATYATAHFIQTFGEWLGTWVAIVGFAVAVLTLILIGGENAGVLTELTGIKIGISSVISMPILGFFILVGGRLTSELIRVLSVIANNTKK